MRQLLVLLCIAHAAVAGAQDRRWEIEGSVGILVAQPAGAGTRTLPSAGAPIVTSLPTFPSRAVPSWSFGDGALLLNGALEELGRTGRVTPLDALFAPPPAAHPAVFGLRLRRRLHPRRSLEIGVDGFAHSSIRTAEISQGLGAAFDSLGPALGDLFASGPFASPKVVIAEGLIHAPYDEMAITAAVNQDAGHLWHWQPYVTFGGGVLIPRDEFFAGASAQSRYTTSILGEVPIDETDSVRVEFTRPKSVIAVLGGGLRCDVTGAWTLRIDTRVLVGPDTTRIRLDATPSVARGEPAGFIESFTNPAIQFSNEPSTGRVSSLSGAALRDVEVFKGGIIARTAIAVTVARRF